MEPETTKPKGQRVAYRRVSTLAQSTARQLDGMTFDREFTDKASGKNTARPALQEALAYVREGDRLIVHSIDRLARNFIDLRKILDDLTKRGVIVEFIKENLVLTGDDKSTSKLILGIFGVVAERERDWIAERRDEGIAVAKRCTICQKTREDHNASSHKFKNKYVGRAPKIRSNNGKAAEFESLLTQGAKVSEIARRLGVSRQTIYSQIKSRMASQNPQTEEVAA